MDGDGTQRLEIGVLSETKFDQFAHRAGTAHGNLDIAVFALLRFRHAPSQNPHCRSA